MTNDGRGGRLHQILWVEGCRSHTISRRRLKLFKPLRRHFPASPFSRMSGASIAFVVNRFTTNNTKGQEGSTIGSSRPAFAGRAAPQPERSLASGGRQNGLDGTGHSAFSFTTAAREQIWNMTSSLSRDCFVERLGR